MTEAQKQLKAKHGTPDEFAAACQDAVGDLMVTPDEAHAAVEKYRREWEAAGGPSHRLTVTAAIDGDGRFNVTVESSGEMTAEASGKLFGLVTETLRRSVDRIGKQCRQGGRPGEATDFYAGMGAGADWVEANPPTGGAEYVGDGKNQK